MGVNIGDTCKLYKKCKICGKLKYLTEFQPTGGRKRKFSTRKSFCRACKSRRHEVILDNRIEYLYDTSILDVSKNITIRGRNTSNHRYENIVSYDKAKRLVEEGAAGIVHSTLIHHFYNKKTFKQYILTRDNYKCHYCGLYGNTVDHKIPRCKGGLSTPNNCVCACHNCNQDKWDTSYEDYILRLVKN